MAVDPRFMKPQPGDDSSEAPVYNKVPSGPSPDNKTRLTILYKVYYERAGKGPTLIPHDSCRLLDTKEQPFQRETEVGEQWEVIKTGWIEDPGLVIIFNTDKKGTLLVGFENAPAGYQDILAWLEIAPEEMLPLSPRKQAGNCIRVRSLKGICQYTVHSLPR